MTSFKDYDEFYFVRCFVKDFVESYCSKMKLYYSILRGEARKPGKMADTLSGIAGQAVGIAVGASIGLVAGMPAQGAKAGSELGKKSFEKIGRWFGCKYHSDKVRKMSMFVRKSQISQEEFKRSLTEAALDIFVSFEMQFSRVDEPEKALLKLAKDAINRSINYYNGNDEAISLDTPLAKSILLGASRIESVGVLSIPWKEIKSPGFKITYKYEETKHAWKTASLFEKAGIDLHPNYETENKYFVKIDKSQIEPEIISRTHKYGYRKLTTSEHWSEMESAYSEDDVVELESSSFLHYCYKFNINDINNYARELSPELFENDIWCPRITTRSRNLPPNGESDNLESRIWFHVDRPAALFIEQLADAHNGTELIGRRLRDIYNAIMNKIQLHCIHHAIVEYKSRLDSIQNVRKASESLVCNLYYRTEKYKGRLNSIRNATEQFKKQLHYTHNAKRANEKPLQERLDYLKNATRKYKMLLNPIYYTTEQYKMLLDDTQNATSVNESELKKLSVYLCKEIKKDIKKYIEVLYSINRYNMSLNNIFTTTGVYETLLDSIHNVTEEYKTLLLPVHNQAEEYKIRLDSIHNATQEYITRLDSMHNAAEEYEMRLDSIHNAAEAYEMELDSFHSATEEYEMRFDSVLNATKEYEMRLDFIPNEIGEYETQLYFIRNATEAYNMRLYPFQNAIEEYEMTLGYVKDVLEKNERRINDIHKAITTRESRLGGIRNAISGVVITGGATTGKSELAKQYVWYFSQPYYNVIWIDAQNAESINRDYESLRARLFSHASTSRTNLNNIFDVLKKRRCLFVFDNVEGFDVIRSYFPFNDSFDQPEDEAPFVLVTSRSREWDFGANGNFSEVHLGAFSHEEAIQSAGVHPENVEEIGMLVQNLEHPIVTLRVISALVGDQNRNLRKGQEKYSILDFLRDI